MQAGRATCDVKMIRSLTAVLITTIALSVAAQPSPRDFAAGPAGWLMTSAEQRAWRGVRTDEQVADFIDLFWARRDPTPGTPPNENRLEFERRVRFADEHFGEKKLRGSLTERGRTLILLGFPEGMGLESAKLSMQGGSAPESDPTGGRALAAKETWVYTHEAAVKFNVPKIEVVFFYDGVLDAVRRDPQRTDFTMALPGAIRSYIVSPELTDVPEWASSWRALWAANAGANEQVETATTTKTVKSERVVIDAPARVAKEAGIGALILLDDSMVLRPQSGRDPLAGVASVTQFRKGRELGWATQYCSGEISENAPPLTVQLKVNAPGGDRFSTDAEEFVPDSIKSAPGCYLLRGALPLMEFEPGRYQVTVTITGAAAGRSYNLTRDFTVE